MEQESAFKSVFGRESGDPGSLANHVENSITIIIGIHPWDWVWVERIIIMACASWKSRVTWGDIQLCVWGLVIRVSKPPCRVGIWNSVTVRIYIRRWDQGIVNRNRIPYCASWRLWYVHNRLQILIRNRHLSSCRRSRWRRQMGTN